MQAEPGQGSHGQTLRHHTLSSHMSMVPLSNSVWIAVRTLRSKCSRSRTIAVICADVHGILVS
eukprot:2631670-Rhodomonas_salina.1